MLLLQMIIELIDWQSSAIFFVGEFGVDGAIASMIGKSNNQKLNAKVFLIWI
jgi:hypothetical protein